MKTNLMKSMLMFMALGALAFTSCSKGGDSPENGPVAVRFTSAIASPTAMTKAAGKDWAPGDKVGIFMADGLSWATADGAANRLYTTTGTNSFAPAPGNEIYFPVGVYGPEVDFYAYYPYLETLPGMDPADSFGTYPVDVWNQTTQANIDFMYSDNAKDVTKANPNVTLTFKHMLSKIIINTTPGEGLTADNLADMTVKIIGMNTKANFDLTVGRFEPATDPLDIKARPITKGLQYEAIVIPASFEIGQLEMQFALNNTNFDVFTRTNTELEAFVTGKVYTYNIIVKRTGVTFTCEIKDWDTVPDPRTGNAE